MNSASSPATSIGRRAQILIALIFIWHVVVGSTLGLGDVEGYYWVWSRELQWSYLDHPPLLAVLLKLTTALFGDNAFAVRLVPATLNAISAWALTKTARLIGDETQAFATTVIFAITPMLLVSGFAASPDGPVVCATSLLILALSQASLKPGWFDPLLVGTLVGLALLAKLSAVVVALSVCLMVALSPALRTRIREPLFWLAPLIAGAIASPIIYWNMQHGWATWQYHGSRPAGFTWTNFGKLIGGQFGFYSPFILAGFLGVLFHFKQTSKEKTIDPLRLRHLGWPTIVFMAYLILRTKDAEPQWTALGYLPGVVLLPRALPAWRARWPQLFLFARRFSIGLLLFALLFLHVHLYTTAIIRLIPAELYRPRIDLANDMSGWPVVARLIKDQAASEPSDRPVVAAATHYTSCGQLSFALDDKPRVVCPSPRTDAFDFIPDRAYPPLHATVYFVADDRFRDGPDRWLRFDHCEPDQSIDIYRAERVVRHYRLWRCLDFIGPV